MTKTNPLFVISPSVVKLIHPAPATKLSAVNNNPPLIVVTFIILKKLPSRPSTPNGKP